VMEQRMTSRQTAMTTVDRRVVTETDKTGTP